MAYPGKPIAPCAFASPPDAKRGKALSISTTDGTVLKLRELPLDDHVNMLLKRGLEQGSGSNNISDNEVVVKALGQYADYAMSKNRYDEAAEQLIGTIGRQDFHSSKAMF